MRSLSSMKSNYFPSKKGFTLYTSVIKHPVEGIVSQNFKFHLNIIWCSIKIRERATDKERKEAMKNNITNIMWWKGNCFVLYGDVQQ